MAYNYEDKLIEAIKYIADSAVAAAPYDRTIQCTIVACDDESTAKYRVRFQDAIFFAYGSDINTHYSDGASVYVLVPGNDSSREKTILGEVNKMGEGYAALTDESILYFPIGGNVIDIGSEVPNTTFRLWTYDVSNTKNIPIKDVHDLNIQPTDIRIDNTTLQHNLKQVSYIRLGANFTTNIPYEQHDAISNYGIIYTLAFNPNNDESSEPIYRDYIIDMNNIINNPYGLTNSDQSLVFPIDGENFLRIAAIRIFQKDFPINKDHSSDREVAALEYDIEIKNFVAVAADRVDESKLDGLWTTMTFPEGNSFDSSDGNSSSRIIKMNTFKGTDQINPQSKKLEYYWFVEDVRVDPNYTIERSFFENNYCKYGGNGWRCLNDKRYVSVDVDGTIEQRLEWIPGEYTYEVVKSTLAARETKYKCVVLYNDYTMYDTKVFIRYDTNYDISLATESGETTFYFDQGMPTLICTATWQGSGTEPTGQKTYIWNKTDNLGIVNYISEATTNTYTVAVRSIYKFATYTCYVYKEGILLGNAKITITNSMETEGQYSLTILNGNKVYKYNEYGIAPNESGTDSPIVIQPLSYILYDSIGKEITHSNIPSNGKEWWVPKENTMLKYDTTGATLSTDEQWYIFKADEFSYTLKDRYNYKYINNTIKLKIKYQGVTITTETDLIFTKEGEPGTNGTDYYCRIIPNYSGSDITFTSPLLIEDVGTNSPLLYYNGSHINIDLKQFLKVQLWKNGDNIINHVSPLTLTSAFSGTSTGELLPYTGKWSILKNKYKSSIEDLSYLTMTASQGWAKYQKNSSYNYLLQNPSPSMSIKCELSYNGINYYAYYPVIWVRNYDNSTYKFDVKGGYSTALYAADGTRPQYNDEPFEIKVYRNGQEASTANDVTYTWSYYGYTNENGTWTRDTGFFIDKAYLNENLAKNQKRVKPADSYDGYCTNMIIECTVKVNNVNKAIIQIPVHFMLNLYNHAALNQWDGNSISIDNNGNGAILAPQIGAGKKNAQTNAFTGIVMGDVKESNHQNAYSGIHGYYEGNRTLFLNAENGSAVFGRQGSGQIVIDPTNSNGKIYSWNFWKSTAYGDDGLPTSYSSANENGAGLLIDLGTSPEIRFGSGNFSVNSSGYLVAKGGGSIADWKISDTKLTSKNNSNIYLDSSATGTSAVLKINSKFSVNANGEIAATGGTIAGWTLSSNRFTSNNSKVYLDSSSSASYAIYAGSGKFYVTPDGALYASSATIKGSIDSGSTITGATITGGSLNIGNGAFSVDSDGSLYASDATIEGSIDADSGYIGDWEISGGSLTNGRTTLKSNGKIVVEDRNGNDVSYIDSDGELYSIYGNIGGWHIDEDFLANDQDSDDADIVFWANGNIDIKNEGVITFNNDENSESLHFVKEGRITDLEGWMGIWDSGTPCLSVWTNNSCIIELDSSEVHITGDLTVDGDATVDGTFS